tara:strand:+ start:249 stop:449 length:201 start_codon:yes stop_codon:yes gene_type:complete
MNYELDELRMQRDIRLRESDWVVTKHLESNKAVPTSWKKYRQDLRDITKTFKSMNDKDFKFPEKPE